MSAHAWMQTAGGRAIELVGQPVGTIDLMGDVADALARLPRFCGQVASGPYSVAQHCVLGARAILEEPGPVIPGRIHLARAFLLHDAHEFVTGDIITPVADALAHRVGQYLTGLLPNAGRLSWQRCGEQAVRAAIGGMKGDVDAAIHAAAGMEWPLEPEIAARVREWDLRMLATERRQLLVKPPKPWHPAVEAAQPARLPGGRITVWPWPKAADEWRTLARSLFPHLAQEAN